MAPPTLSLALIGEQTRRLILRFKEGGNPELPIQKYFCLKHTQKMKAFVYKCSSRTIKDRDLFITQKYDPKPDSIAKKEKSGVHTEG